MMKTTTVMRANATSSLIDVKWECLCEKKGSIFMD